MLSGAQETLKKFRFIVQMETGSEDADMKDAPASAPCPPTKSFSAAPPAIFRQTPRKQKPIEISSMGF